MAPINLENVYPPEPKFVHFPSRRSTVHGTKGMISSSQPLANQAGLRVLLQGGNAADAAVAVAAALNVTEPGSTGIGGDMFCLFYDAKTKTVKGLNGSGRSPKALDMPKARELGISGTEIPLDNINAATVPGAAAGWVDTLKLFGSGEVTMEDVLTPAIELAEDGFPVSEISAYYWGLAEQQIKAASPNFAEMLSKVTGKAPKAGELMHNSTLAQTFRAVAKEGFDGFYKGRIADAIVELVKSRGGVMTHDDLASHTSTPVDPINIDFKGLTVWECPPNGQGIVALMALGILQEMEAQGRCGKLDEMEHNSPEYLHAIIEALRLAFADAKAYVSDQDVEHVPTIAMLNKDYLASRAKLFDPSKQTADLKEGTPVNSSDTVYFTTADRWGNACSFIISNYAGFGTGAIPKNCGFTLQNRGSNFVLVDGHPNMLKGRKRPYHTIIPAMVTDSKTGELWASYGVMGGFMQPQGHVQVLLNLLHHGTTPQAALDAPRICLGAGMPDAGPIDSTVYIEEGIPEATVEKLKAMGHKVVVATEFQRGTFGRGQVIRCHKDGKDKSQVVWSGGSDMRGDGAALGW
ncbi:gamma-glutamyltranspeptidase [Saitoella complicata NRRL Y-17804]|nr:gamma-glutamyltranspeptidase [Saitoella complicata NRRL Y-17804]ODQ54970.1 gamma-glutamyltranspeptidase [Saitoella complicata NRRL Y-17804]